MGPQIDHLVREARSAAAEHRWSRAEELWRAIESLSPNHVEALYRLGVRALDQRDQSACALLERAHTAAPADKTILLALASARGLAGDNQGELNAILAALAIDPYFLPALLSKANALERLDQADSSLVYANVLKIAPPEQHWPPEFRPQLAHARAVVHAYRAALEAHIAHALKPSLGDLPHESVPRWREAAAIMSGTARPFTSESNQLHVPRLPAIPFYDRSHFPWIAALEAQTTAIRDELLGVLHTARSEFSPYIAYNPGDPVNQWADLNHSERWSAFHLWRSGTPVADAIRRCPVTVSSLEVVDTVDIAGLCPNAMFSALAPHTHIPPHNGETNARLVAHLPLIVPEGCWLRVGFDKIEWKVGHVVVFDDTIEHEAMNDSDELRVVLIFDVWNPLLSEPERDMVRRLAAAARSFDSTRRTSQGA